MGPLGRRTQVPVPAMVLSVCFETRAWFGWFGAGGEEGQVQAGMGRFWFRFRLLRQEAGRPLEGLRAGAWDWL